MFVLARTIVYASLFVGLLLVYLPARLLSRTGVTQPKAIGEMQVTGTVLAGTGAAIALWCVGAFVVYGRGTPAPFDPPRRLVTTGPYRFVRNPMYMGAALAISGGALFYGSLSLFLYAVLFMVASHLFIVIYEEPVLRRLFGTDYEVWCTKVHRWLPRWR